MKKWTVLLFFSSLVGLVVLVNLSAKSKKDLSSVKIGAVAPNFTLPDPTGKKHALSDYKGKYVILEWTNYGCPYVKKHYNTNNMQNLQKEMAEKEVVWLSICSSAKGKQGYMKPKEWTKAIEERKVASSAVLLDPKGDTGRLYGAKTTPHMYIIDPKGILVYQGAIDDRPTADKADVEGAKNYVRTALQESLAEKAITTSKTDPYGCSVKY